MCPLSASPPEVFCCFLTASCTSARLFINPPDLFHGLPASYAALRLSGQASKLPVRLSAILRTRLLTTKQQSNPYFFLRKEVIQPHLPIRLPCYDFTPVITPAFDSSFLSVRSLASGIRDSHGVTGGVYKTRERIHRDILIRDY